MSTPVRPELTGRQLSINEAAELLGIDRETVRRWIARGELRATRYGARVIRIDPADLAAVGEPVAGATFELRSGHGA